MNKTFARITTVAVTCCMAITVFAQSPYSIERCIALAKQNNVAMHNARRGAESATEQRKEAFTNYFPQVSAMGAGFASNKHLVQVDIDPASIAAALPPEMLSMMSGANLPTSINAVKNGLVGNVVAMQPVFAGGQIITGNKLAKLGQEVSNLQLSQTEQDVTVTTTQFYWNLVCLKEQVRTIDAAINMLDTIARDVEVAISAGVTLRNDLLQVQLKRNDMVSKRLQLVNGINLSRMVLAQYIGVEFNDSFDIDTPSIEVSGELSHSDHSADLVTLPEYKMLEKVVDVDRLQYRMEMGKNLPTVAVGAGLVCHNLMDKTQANGLVMAQVSIPISGWWGGSHALKRKKIAIEQSQESLIDNAQKLTIRMQKTYDDLSTAYSRLAIARQSVEQASENLRLQSDCYHAGALTMSDLLEAQTSWQEAQSSLTERLTQCKIAEAEYLRATGHLSR